MGEKVRAVTREEMREIDRRAIEEFGIAAATLMENAGRAVADVVLQEFNPLAVTVVCGPGNNGGDGFVVARHLVDAGVEVCCHAPAPESAYSGAALEMRRRVKLSKLEWLDVVVDAVFGTGLSRPVTGPWRELIEEMNDSPPIVAADVPSGMDADTGRPLGVAVEADITVTFGWPKVGMLQEGARTYTGRVIVADIGFPKELGGRS